MDNIKLIKIPFDINGKNYSYDFSVVSYKNGDPSKPRVGSYALEEEEFLIKNIKQVMKHNAKDRANRLTWEKDNFVFNERMNLEKFKPDLPFFSFKTLIEKIVINQIGSYLRLYNKESKFKDMDLLFGIPVFSNVEGMPEKQRNKYKDEYKNSIRTVLKKLNINNKVHFLYEPFAIIRHAIHYKLLNFKEQRNDVLIIDFGGSTFNCCIVRTTFEGRLAEANKFKNVFGTNYNPWGCSEVDKFILEKIVRQKLDDKSYKFSNKDYHKAELLKIKISEDIRKNNLGPWKFKLDNIDREISISNNDFRELLHQNLWPRLKATIRKTVMDANKELTDSIDKLDFVLLAGGGSNLPYLKDFFKEDLIDLIKSDESLILIDKPQLAVASGLAIDALYKLNKTGDSLSDDEFLENELYLELKNREHKILECTKIRLSENPQWFKNGKVLDTSIRKEDLISNTKNEAEKKPWEVKLNNKIISKKLEYFFYNDESKSFDSQIDRFHIDLKELPSGNLKEIDLFLDTDENGQVTPSIQWKGGNLYSSKKPFELWSYTPSKDMIAIDLGNSTTSMFLITDDQDLKEEDIMDVRNFEINKNGMNNQSKSAVGTEDINQTTSISKISDNYKIDEERPSVEPSKKVIQDWKNDLILELNLKDRSVKEYINIQKVNKEILNNWINKWKTLGYYYEYKLVSQIIITLQANKIPVLYGPPGFGKSKILELIAKEISAIFSPIPIKPNWRDSSNLMGKEVELTEFQKAVFASNYTKKLNDSEPRNCLVCFDELNLSHPEYYMADLLSILELNQEFRQIKIHNESFQIPPNLLLAGTINVDHTTKILSPKLKNRVKFIRFGEGELRLYDKLSHLVEEDILQSEEFREFIDLLEKLNNCLKSGGMSISYRVLDYFNLIIKNQKSSKLLTELELYDYLLTSSIIPSLDFNKFSKNHELVVNQLKEKILNDSELGNKYPDFIKNLKRIIEDFQYSTITSGLF